MSQAGWSFMKFPIRGKSLNKEKMKVIILAGGFGTRLSEITELLPKPMVKIGGMPIIWHIMKTYAAYGFNEFIIALGYKADYVKDYFLNYSSLNSNFSLDMSSGEVTWLDRAKLDWKVTLVDTGLNSMTGGRIKRLQNLIGDESFMVTYGDGVADIDINRLIAFHKKHGKIATLTTVHPGARFGGLELDGEKVISFKEKPQTGQGWINGGFFVFNHEIFDYIEDDSTILEREPLERIAEVQNLVAYRHEGFWQCMDNLRDRNYLEELWRTNNAPWRKG